MTREEAIEIFKVWIQRDKELQEKGLVDRLENIELYNMAISALENNYNSAENNDKMQDSAIKVDLISKQDILFSLSYYELEDVIDEQDFGFNHAIQTIRSDVMTMETYSAQTTKEDTAEWILKNYGEHYCSNCGTSALNDNDCYEKLSDYCPNCGARMKGDAEK